MGTKLVFGGGLWITSVNDIATHQTNFSTHLKLVISVHLEASVVHVLKRSIKNDHTLSALHSIRDDVKELSLVLVIVCGCDHDSVACLPLDLFDESELCVTWIDSCIQVSP